MFPLGASNTKTPLATAVVSSASKTNASLGRLRNAKAIQQQHVDSPHTLAASYYSLRDGLSARLMVSDQGPRPMDIRITLFALSGERLDLPTASLAAQEVREFDLEQQAKTAGPAFAEGSLAVSYTGMNMELGGVLKLVDLSRGLVFDEELSEPTTLKSSRLEGVWWLPSPRADLRIVVSNSSDAEVSATLSADGSEPNRLASKALSLGRHQTRIIDIDELYENGEARPRIGGISVLHSGAPGAILTRALVQEPATGYSSVIEFYDPNSAKSSKFDGAGLRIGAVGEHKLRQIAVARNVGDQPTTLIGRIPYVGEDGSTGVISVPNVNLAPSETRVIDLVSAINSAQLKTVESAGLEFEYSSAPGSVVMSALSMTSDGNQVFRVPLVDVKSQTSSTGKYPWAIDDNSSTVVYIKNATDEPQEYVISITYPGGAYTPGLKTVPAKETVIFDLRKLRDDQVPDDDGKKLPNTASNGHVYWSARGAKNLTSGMMAGPDNKVMIGRAEQVDIVNGLSTTASCSCGCQGSYADSWIEQQLPDGSWTRNSPIELVFGETVNLRAREIDTACYGYTEPYTHPANWGSQNDPVATFPNYDAVLHGVNFGTTQIGASWDAPIWYPFYDCCEFQSNTANPTTDADVAGIRAYVTNPPFSGDGDAVVSGQQFSLLAEIVKPSGERVTSFNGNASFFIEGGTLVSGETVPTGISLSNGAGSTDIIFKAVPNTGVAGRSYHVTFSSGSSSTNFGGFFNLYFSVTMDVERWKNCDFVNCPNFGSYFCARGCDPFTGFLEPTSFITLPDGTACGAAVRVVNAATRQFGGTNVSDIGPAPLGNRYWLTGNTPSMGGCLSDNFATLIGIDNGCNPNRGEGRVYWRFIPQ